MRRDPRPTSKPKAFGQYFATVSSEKRVALEKLRRSIRKAAPELEECISYGLPAFRLNGKFLVAFGVTAKGCSFYLGSSVQAYKNELKKYDTSKGTIRFLPTNPLPEVLIRKLIRGRIAERGKITASQRSRK